MHHIDGIHRHADQHQTAEPARAGMAAALLPAAS